MIYFASSLVNTTSKLSVSNTLLHTSQCLPLHLHNPTFLSIGYSLALTR